MPKPDPEKEPEKQDPETKDDPAKKTPWTDDTFDPDRAAKLLDNLKEEREALRKDRDELRDKVKTFEDQSKSDHEKLEERATTAEQRASAAEADATRLRVALKKGLTETQAKRLIGDTEEDIEKDADELLASFKSDDDENKDDAEQDSGRRPKEALRPGAVPSADADTSDPAALANKVPRGW